MNYLNGFLRRGSLLLGLSLVSFSLWSCNQSGAPGGAPPSSLPLAVSPAANYHADWSHQPAFVQNAIAVQGRHENDLLNISGVIGDGVGLDHSNPNAAVILVFTEHPGVAGIPEMLEGLKTQTEMVGPVTAYGYTGNYRTPLPAGVSVGDNDECAAGSIGALVSTTRLTSSGSYTGTYEATGNRNDVIHVYSAGYSWPSTVNSGTPAFMLSCNHVFANENAATSADQQDQPGRYDNSCNTGNGVGKLYAWNYIDSHHNNYYDAALAECDPGLSGGWTPTMSPDAQYTPTNTVVSPSLDLSVQKVGRTTGYTNGTIAGINVTITVGYTHFHAKFVDQIYIASGTFIEAGDSGSMMVDGNDNPVGLNFAGSSTASFANRMDHIAHDFGLSFVTASF
ncbi:MAG TPA: hypothetical protein VFH95_05615 [Candidatus Kapabacteria bacterium]|nr:hypothetical protein [Candidatus Kapabacteria bacterium]